MYRCQDQEGTTILTDNPAQLTNCSELTVSYDPAPKISINNARVTDDQNPLPIQIPDHSGHKNKSNFETINQASINDPEITIPLKNIGGSLVVEVHLNGERTADLIVDTGASLTVLSTNIAIDLGILGTTDNELLTVNTAGGSVQVNMNYLSSLNVGNAQAKNVAVAIHDLPDIPEQIEGLLGMSFLKHFLVTLDAEHARLILRRRQAS